MLQPHLPASWRAHPAHERPLPSSPFSPPAAPRLVKLLTPLLVLAASGGAWGYFIATFGWSGALLGWWPAAVIGGGGALAAIQVIELYGLGFKTRRAEPQPVPADARVL